MRIACIAVFMVGKFIIEHVENEAVTGFVGVNGVEQLFTMTFLHFTVGRQVAFADDVASAINSTHLVRIRRFQPQLFHRLFELFVSKGKYHRKSADFFLMAPIHFNVCVHVMYPSFSDYWNSSMLRITLRILVSLTR